MLKIKNKHSDNLDWMKHMVLLSKIITDWKGQSLTHLLLRVTATATGGAATSGCGLYLGRWNSLCGATAVKTSSRKGIPRWRWGKRGRWWRRRNCLSCSCVAGSGDVRQARPKRWVPRSRVINAVGNGVCRWWNLNLCLSIILIINLLLRLYLWHFDLLSGLGNWRTVVCGLCGHCRAGYLTGVLRSSERVPMFGLRKVPSLYLWCPVVTTNCRERKESLWRRRGHSVKRWFVEKQARVL